MFPLAGDVERGRRDRVIQSLREMRVPFEERPLLAEYGGPGASIHVNIPRLPEEDGEPGENPQTFMLAVPLAGPGENGPGEELPFGLQTALAFIEKIRRAGAEMDVRVAFLGNEGSRLPPEIRRDFHPGLLDLASLPEIPEDTALWYLDLDAPPERLLIHHGSRRSVAPLNLLRSLPALSALHRVPYSLAIRYNEIYKLALAEGPPVLEITRERGINALYVSAGKAAKSPGGPEKITREDLAAFLAAYAVSLRIPAENLDTHYSILHLPGKDYFIPEQWMVIMTLLAASVFLLYLGVYSILRRETLIMRRNVFLRYGWMILVFLGILVAALQGAALCYTLLSRVFPRPLPPRYETAGLCFVFAMLIFSLSAPFLDRAPVPWKEVFYGNAALILVTAGVLIAAALDITFIPIFFWAFIFTLAGTQVRNPVLVYLCALVTPIQAFSALLNVVEMGSRKLAEALLRGDFLITLYVALISLPFVFLMKRGALLLRRHPPRPIRRALIPRAVLASLSFLLLFLYVRESAGNLPPAPIRRAAGETEAGRPLKLSVRDDVFLESRFVDLVIEAPGNPVRFDISLESGGNGPPPLIYSASLPTAAEGGVLRFVLGEGPPNPFTAELSLPLNSGGILRAEALYTEWDGEIDPGPPPPPGSDYLFRLVSFFTMDRTRGSGEL